MGQGHRRPPLLLLPVFVLVLLCHVLVTLVTVGCDTGSPATGSPAAPPAVTVQTTAPDDLDPMAAKLAREASAHRAAPAVPPVPAPAPTASATASIAATPAPMPAFTGALPPPEGLRWQDSGVLVLELLGEEDAKTEAASLRWTFSNGGAGAWTNNVDAIHVYEKLWAVRISPMDLVGAKRVCAWLGRPQKPDKPSWLDANARRVCRFTSKPTLTSKTEYEILGPAGR